MAGSSPGAVHALNARVQMGAARTALHDMSAVKCDHIQIGADKVQAQRSAPAQANHSIPPVDDPDGPSDQIILLQHAIEQFDLYLRGGVGQRHDEGIPFFLRAVEGGQTFQRILASAYLAVHIPQICGPAPIGELQCDRRQAEISHTTGGVFLWERVQGKGPIASRLIGVGGKPPVLAAKKIGQVAARNTRTVVAVQQHVIVPDFHLIGGIFGVQSDKFVFLVKNDHRGPSSDEK